MAGKGSAPVFPNNQSSVPLFIKEDDLIYEREINKTAIGGLQMGE